MRHPCIEPGCRTLTGGGRRCSKHFYVNQGRKEERAAVAAWLRSTAAARYSDTGSDLVGKRALESAAEKLEANFDKSTLDPLRAGYPAL
jgi:hypothetical protein